MLWIEMSRDTDHGGPGWGFGECLWSPSHKNPSGQWPFWNSLLNVKRDDLVVHLQGGTHRAAFVGYSTALSDGYVTTSRPALAKEWSYASSYHRVDLLDFVPFSTPVLLDDVFAARDEELRSYFGANRVKASGSREHLFYVIQAGRLQCQNGAYLSQLGDGLLELLLGSAATVGASESKGKAPGVSTGEALATVKARIGQGEFSRSVRHNFGSRCCVPGCDVAEQRFLVGAHIARWADVPELRGELSNGLCFCLLHDRAFELGLFTLTDTLRVSLHPGRAPSSAWARVHLGPLAGQSIGECTIRPDVDALRRHWERIGYVPSDAGAVGIA